VLSTAVQSTTARGVAALDAPPPLDALLGELADPARVAELFIPGSGRLRRTGHVFLTACHSSQDAYEIPSAGGHRGVFSLTLLEQLERLGPQATYRELTAAVRCGVESRSPDQRPLLFPADDPLVDQPFLGGELKAPAAPLTMYQFDAAGRWVIDAGACHGVDPGEPREPRESGELAEPGELEELEEPGDGIRVAVVGAAPVREARIVTVLPERSVLEPIGWRPEPLSPYPVVVTGVPMPAAAVALGGGPGDDEATVALVAAAVHAAGRDGAPSRQLRVIDLDDGPARPVELRVSAPAAGLARITDRAGNRLAPDAHCASADEAAAIVTALEHIVRWRRIRDLGNPASRLAGAVRIEIVPALPGETLDPLDRAPLRTGADGALALYYRHGAGGLVPPRVFVRLRNTAERRLHCALLDLTDRFEVFTGLFPGGWVGAGVSACAAKGAPIAFGLPEDTALRGGVRVADWLKVLICEEPFGSEVFALPPLGGGLDPDPTPVPEHGGAYPHRGTLDRLGLAAAARDAPRPDSARDWSTGVLTVVTRVP
jgi:hypothetical protein